LSKRIKEILTSNASGAAGLARAVKNTSLQPFLELLKRLSQELDWAFGDKMNTVDLGLKRHHAWVFIIYFLDVPPNLQSY